MRTQAEGPIDTEPWASTKDILRQVERAVVNVLRQAGIEPNFTDPWQTRRQAQDLGESERDAAFVFMEARVLTEALNRDDAVQRALVLMHEFVDAKYRHTWGVKLEAFEESRKRQVRGAADANLKKQQRADEFWPPYEQRYAELRAEGIGPHKAAEIIMIEGCPRGLSTIKTRMKKWSER